MQVGDKIYYGSEKEQHIDEIEKDEKGYYGRYTVNNATTEHYPTIKALIESYVKNKYWLYVTVKSDQTLIEYKNIEKEIENDGIVLTEDIYIDIALNNVTIKTIRHNGDIYYLKTIKSLEDTTTIIKILA